MSTTDITTFQSLVEIIFQLYPFSTSQFVRIGQGEPSGSTVSHLKLRLFSNYTHFTTSQFVRIGQGEPLGSTVSHLKLRLFSNYTHFTTSQFVRIGQGEPSGSTVSHLKLRLFYLSTELLLEIYNDEQLIRFNLKLRLFSLSTKVCNEAVKWGKERFNLKLRLFSLSTWGDKEFPLIFLFVSISS